jgi:C4-type Zn-finger protein
MLADKTCPLCEAPMQRRIADWDIFGKSTKLTKEFYCTKCNYRSIKVKEKKNGGKSRIKELEYERISVQSEG